MAVDVAAWRLLPDMAVDVAAWRLLVEFPDKVDSEELLKGPSLSSTRLTLLDIVVLIVET